MPVFKGNTSSSATSTAYSNATKIVSFSVTDKSGGGATINVSILYGSTNTLISSHNQAIAANAVYTDTRTIVLPAGYQIYLLSNVSVDFFFSIEND